MLIASPHAYAKSPSVDQNLKLITLIEEAFGKATVVSRPRDIKGEDFNFNSFKLVKKPDRQKEYLSNFLKLNSLNLIEGPNEVYILQARDAVKMNIPVFKESVPEGTREQMVVVIKSIPKHLRNKQIDRLFRSHYSNSGDLKISADKKKIIISDWASNTRKIIGMMENL
jgi:hypothetical protein